MSRIGRMPIAIPAGVEVKIDGSVVTVKGAKATLTREFHPNMTIAVEGNEILVTRPNDDKHNRALHGLTRSLVHNMVVGVTEGFKKELSVQGVGYRVAKQGKDLVMNLGYSHQVTMSEVEGITIDVPNPNTIIISGPDKQKVGQFAAEVREKRPPEPYKGKGGILGSYLLMMFYTMVGGWMLYYAYMEATGKLAGLDNTAVSGAFSNMLSTPQTMALWAIIAIVISFGACAFGVQKGVEKVTKVMMILLLVLMIALAVNSVFLPNASEGIKFYLVPDFKSVKQVGIGNAVFAAMSQAFFTLSLGIGAMEIFGSYLDKKKRITGEAVNIVLLDTFVALMAGFIIIPACFAFGVQPDSGPSLLFITLPNLFNSMKGGRIWGTLFFIFMSFAALSTIIAVFENIIAMFMDMCSWSRKKSVAVNYLL